MSSPLLSLLEKDFGGKTTVKECCSTRGHATLPAAEVKKALSDESLVIDKTTLSVSKGSILLLLGELRKARDAAPPKPSIHYFSTIAITCHWIQFLCEYKSRAQVVGQENESSSAQEQEGTTFTDDEVKNMIKSVLLSMTGVVAFLLKKQATSSPSSANKGASSSSDSEVDNDEDDVLNTVATESFDPRQIAVFCFVSISRLNHYVHVRPTLMGMIWKGLEEIAGALKPFPDDLGTMVFRDLNNYLTEGVQELVTVTSNLEQQQSKPDKHHSLQQQLQQLANQCKVLRFVLSRIIHFCDLSWVATNVFRRGRLKNLMGQLSLVMGISVLHGASNARVKTNDKGAVNEHLTQLAKKAKGVLSSLLRTAENDTVFWNMTSRAILTCEVDKTNNNDRCVPDGAFATTALAAGKLAIHWQQLDHITSKKNDDLTDDVLHGILETCEDSLYVNIPRIVSGYISMTDSSVLGLTRQTLKSVIEAFVFIGSSACSAESGTKSLSERFHFLLISWMHRVASEDCHPLSRELYLASICGYYREISCHGKDDSFISLVVDLLFDARTQDSLRRCLAEFVLRLSVNPSAKGALEPLITTHAEKLVRNQKDGTRKRKRSQRRQISSQSLTILLPVLALSGACGENASNRPNTTISLLTSSDVAKNQIVNHIQSFNVSAMRKEYFSKRMESTAFGALLLVEQHCRNLGTVLSPEGVQTITQLLTLCCDKGASAELAEKGVELISIISDSLSVNMMRNDCEKILGIFHNSLRSDVWPLRARALAAFLVFAKKVPSDCKDSMRDCLPDSMKKVFQSRLKKAAVYGDDVLRNAKFQHNQGMVNTLVAERQSLFSSYSSMHIPEGSYVMTMPTVENREAIVIFPPRPESLEDISYMLQDESDRPVQKLRRVITTQGGCKLSLCETEKG